MVSCSSCGRSKSERTKKEGISFHAFPRSDHRREMWIKFVDRNEWVPKKGSYLCSQHFELNCFSKCTDAKMSLKNTAIPTIRINRLKYDRQSLTAELAVQSTALPSTSFVATSSQVYPISLICSKTIPVAVSILKPSTSTIASSSQPSTPKKNVEVSLTIEPVDTPREIHLKRKLQELSIKCAIQSKKMRTMQKKIWVQKKRITSLNAVVATLKKKCLLSEDSSEMFPQSFEDNKNKIKIEQENSNDTVYSN